MKYCLLVLMLVSGQIFTLPASAEAQEKKLIGLSIPTADHGWTGGVVWWARKAVDDLATRYPNVEIILMPASSPEKQIADLETMISSRGVEALVILPHDPALLAPELKKAEEAGVFITVVDRVLPEVPRHLYVSGDNYSLGWLSGEFMARELGGLGGIVVMGGIPSDVDSLRQQGFKDALAKHPGLKIIDNQPAMWNSHKGMEIMEDFLKKYPKIDAVWCQDDDVLKGVLEAYSRSGRKDVKLIMGGGGSREVIKMIMDGHPLVRGTVTYPPKMIYEGLVMTIRHLVDGQEFQTGEVIPSELVTRANAEDFYYPDSIY